MARVLIVGGFLAVVFWVFCIVDCAVQPATRHRGVSKAVWVLIVVLLPVIGGVLWLTLGRLRSGDIDTGYVVPADDDPQVLRRMGNAEQDARIEQLEAELARLDDESDGSDPRS